MSQVVAGGACSHQELMFPLGRVSPTPINQSFSMFPAQGWELEMQQEERARAAAAPPSAGGSAGLAQSGGVVVRMLAWGEVLEDPGQSGKTSGRQ